MISPQEILTFILQYRRGKAFDGWSPTAIKVHLLKAIHNHTIVTVSDDGVIQGVIVGEFAAENEVHITAAIKRPGSKHILSKAWKLWHNTLDYSLSACRHDKYVELTPRYTKLLETLA